MLRLETRCQIISQNCIFPQHFPEMRFPIPHSPGHRALKQVQHSSCMRVNMTVAKLLGSDHIKKQASLFCIMTRVFPRLCNMNITQLLIEM